MTATFEMTATVEPNILASATFGPASRYRLDVFQSRFDKLVFLVFDAEEADEYGMPGLIRVSDDDEIALSGLDGADDAAVKRAVIDGTAAWLGIDLAGID